MLYSSTPIFFNGHIISLISTCLHPQTMTTTPVTTLDFTVDLFQRCNVLTAGECNRYRHLCGHANPQNAILLDTNAETGSNVRRDFSSNAVNVVEKGITKW